MSKTKLSEIIDKPEFRYLFGNFCFEFNETEKALLGLPSVKTREQALMDWQTEPSRIIKFSEEKHTHS